MYCWLDTLLSLCDPTDCSPPGSSVHGGSPGKSTGVGRHSLLQVRHTYILRIKITSLYGIYIPLTHSGDCGVHALCGTHKYIAPKHILPLGTRVKHIMKARINKPDMQMYMYMYVKLDLFLRASLSPANWSFNTI